MADRGATSSSPDAIKVEIAKLSYLRELGADRLDLSAIPPRAGPAVGHRRAALDAQGAAGHASERRYPVLLATLAGTWSSIIDEVVQMFDQALPGPQGQGQRSG